jgi:hypothetical protein
VTFSGTAGGTLVGAVSGGPATYSVSVTGMTAPGTVIASLLAGVGSDAAGNTSAASTSTDNSVTWSPAGPTVLGAVRDNATPTNAASVSWTVTFTESVTGVDASDFAVTAVGGSFSVAPGVTMVSGSGASYTVTASTGTHNGQSAEIRLDIADDDTIVNGTLVPIGGAGAGNGNFTGGETYVIDQVNPVLSTIGLAAGQMDPTETLPVLFEVMFSESVTGFTTSNVNTGASTAPGTLTVMLSGSGAGPYTIEVDGATGSGVIAVSITGAGITDATGNTASTPGSSSVQYNLPTSISDWVMLD